MANRDYSKRTGKYIKITNVYPLKLRDINDSIAQKDGFNNAKELKEFWVKKLSSWNPSPVVYVHEFDAIEKDS